MSSICDRQTRNAFKRNPAHQKGPDFFIFIYLDSFQIKLIFGSIFISGSQREMENCCSALALHELYHTEFGAVLQCNSHNCYWLEFEGKRTSFKIRDLFLFKNKVDAIDLQAMLLDPAPHADLEVLMPFRTTHCFVLDIKRILRLRDLLGGAKFMIQLNSVLHSNGIGFSNQDVPA